MPDKLVEEHRMYPVFLTLALFCGGQPQAPAVVMRKYLEALKALDHERMRLYWAADCVVRNGDGSVAPLNRERMKNFREFERVMNTKWDYRIVGVGNDEVTVLLTEKMDYYDLLGVGLRTQMNVYTVRDGLIRVMETRHLAHARGDLYLPNHEFKVWLRAELGARAPELLNKENGLIYNGQSARKMLPLLRKWSQLRKGRRPDGRARRRLRQAGGIGRNFSAASPTGSYYFGAGWVVVGRHTARPSGC